MNDRVGKTEVNDSKCQGVCSEMADSIKALDSENRDLREANKNLRKSSDYFAMGEFDRWSK